MRQSTSDAARTCSAAIFSAVRRLMVCSRYSTTTTTTKKATSITSRGREASRSIARRAREREPQQQQARVGQQGSGAEARVGVRVCVGVRLCSCESSVMPTTRMTLLFCSGVFVQGEPSGN